MPDEVLIRFGKHQDAPAVAQFNVAMAKETEQKQLSLKTVTQGVKAVLEQPEHGFYVVAEQNGDAIGSLLVTFEWSDWRCARFWWIQSVYVRPDCRAQGVFRRLYSFLEEEAERNSGVCGFRLYVEQSNHRAQQTYTRLGMEKTGYDMYESLFEGA